VPSSLQLGIVAGGTVIAGQAVWGFGRLVDLAGLRRAGGNPRAGSQPLELLVLDEAEVRSLAESVRRGGQP